MAKKTLVESQAIDYKPTGLTGATAASRYVGATASGAPASGTFAVGDFVIDQSGRIYICTTAGSPGTWTIANIANQKGYVNHGSTAGTARPAGFTSVEWYGSVQPTNAVAGDTWIDTS